MADGERRHNPKRLSAVESCPIDAQLSNSTADCANLQIATTPIRHDGRAVRRRILPFAMRACSATSDFLASECRQLASDITIFHRLAIKASDQTTPPDSGREMLAGSARPSSSYNST